jgi:O-antigen biosynthesis rhamnosyltransferase
MVSQKVLHVYKTYYPDSMGGIEQLMRMLIDASPAHGVQAEAFVITLQGKSGTLTVGGASVHRSAGFIELNRTPLSFCAFSNFYHLAKQFDVIHYHVPYPFADVLHFTCRVNKPTLVTYHSDVIKQRYALVFYRPLLHAFLSSVDAVVATSPHYLESSPVLSRFKDKTQVISLGLDPKAYPAISSSAQARWHKRFGSRFFLFVGVLRYYKGLTYLLQACVGRDYPVVIAGSGPEEAALKREVDALGLRSIYFLGSVSDEDKASLLSACFAFVFPSHLRSEAFGLSLLEASMYGKPMVCCDLKTGTTYINQHQQTGLVVPPADPQALRRALDLLWSDSEAALMMGRAAAKRFQSHFTADRMVTAYMDLYKKLSKKQFVT